MRRDEPGVALYQRVGIHPSGGTVTFAARAVVALAGLAPALAGADPVAYRIDGAHTRAEFTIEHLGVFQARGRFGAVSGRIVFDGTAHAGSIDLDIPVSSVATGYEMRDDFIRGVTMFDAARYPSMRFRSSKFEFDGDRLVRVEGELTVRDVTRNASFNVLRIECGHEMRREACTAEAEGAIRRREFGMENWWPLIGDEVALRFRLSALRD